MIFNTKFNNYSLNFIKVLLIVKIEIKERNTSLNLVLIQWYDFKSQSHLFLYGCSRLELTEIYNFIDIEAIQDIVHTVLSTVHWTRSNGPGPVHWTWGYWTY